MTARMTVKEARKKGILPGGKRPKIKRSDELLHLLRLLRLIHDLAVAGYASAPEYKFHPDRNWRFDLALLDRKIALEIDGGGWVGGAHHRPVRRRLDCEKDAAAQLLGWRVLRVDHEQVASGHALELLLEHAGARSKIETPENMGADWLRRNLECAGLPAPSELGCKVADILGGSFFGLHNLAIRPLKNGWSSEDEIVVRWHGELAISTESSSLMRLALRCVELGINFKVFPGSYLEWCENELDEEEIVIDPIDGPCIDLLFWESDAKERELGIVAVNQLLRDARMP